MLVPKKWLSRVTYPVRVKILIDTPAPPPRVFLRALENMEMGILRKTGGTYYVSLREAESTTGLEVQHWSVLTIANPVDVAFGEFNGDNRGDGIAINASGNCELWDYAHSAKYAVNITPPSGFSAEKIAAGDYNGDGLDDLGVLWADATNSQIYLYKNDGSWGFTFFGGIGTVSCKAIDFTFGDLDGDGDKEVVFVKDSGSGNWNATVSSYDPSGSGALVYARCCKKYEFESKDSFWGWLGAHSHTKYPDPVSIAAGDLNGDGKDDVIVLNNAYDQLEDYDSWRWKEGFWPWDEDGAKAKNIEFFNTASESMEPKLRIFKKYKNQLDITCGDLYQQATPKAVLIGKDRKIRTISIAVDGDGDWDETIKELSFLSPVDPLRMELLDWDGDSRSCRFMEAKTLTVAAKAIALLQYPPTLGQINQGTAEYGWEHTGGTSDSNSVNLTATVSMIVGGGIPGVMSAEVRAEFGASFGISETNAIVYSTATSRSLDPEEYSDYVLVHTTTYNTYLYQVENAGVGEATQFVLASPSRVEPEFVLLSEYNSSMNPYSDLQPSSTHTPGKIFTYPSSKPAIADSNLIDDAVFVPQGTGALLNKQVSVTSSNEKALSVGASITISAEVTYSGVGFGASAGLQTDYTHTVTASEGTVFASSIGGVPTADYQKAKYQVGMFVARRDHAPSENEGFFEVGFWVPTGSGQLGTGFMESPTITGEPVVAADSLDDVSGTRIEADASHPCGLEWVRATIKTTGGSTVYGPLDMTAGADGVHSLFVDTSSISPATYEVVVSARALNYIGTQQETSKSIEVFLPVGGGLDVTPSSGSGGKILATYTEGQTVNFSVAVSGGTPPLYLRLEFWGWIKFRASESLPCLSKTWQLYGNRHR